MFRPTNISFIIALLISLFGFHTSAVADTCYAQSPNLVSAGGEYYDFDDNNTFSAIEKDKLNRLFKRLTGKWKGKAVIADCFGPDHQADKKLKHAVININNQQNANGGLTVFINQKIIEDRVNNAEALSLLVPSNTFYLSFLSDNHLVFSEKYRRKNFAKKAPTNVASSNTISIINKNNLNITNSPNLPAPQKVKTATRLIEIIYDLTLENGTFTLLKSYYTNGVYTGEEMWSLRAD